MKTQKLLLFLSATLLTLSCCKPDDDSGGPQVYHFLLPQEVKDYYAFKDGTYWVYENDKTKELDSITVFFHQHKIDTIIDTERNHELIFEIFRLITYSHRDDYKTEYYPLPPVLRDEPPTNNTIIEREKYKSGDYVGVTSVLFHPYEIGAKRGLLGVNGIAELTNIYSQLTIDGKDYQNVLEFNITEDITFDKNNIKYYHAPHIGIVKIENITDNSSWILKRYNIVQ